MWVLCEILCVVTVYVALFIRLDIFYLIVS